MCDASTMYFNTAHKIGMELVRDAIWHNDRCNWIGSWADVDNGKAVFVTKSFDTDLYAGLSGVAFFLASLYQEEKDRLLKKTIEGTVAQVQAANGARLPAHGFYLGKPGVAFSLLHIGRMLDREDWQSEGINQLLAIEPALESTFEWDLLLGAAGTIIALLYGYNASGNEALLDKAIKLGYVLCNNATPCDRGVFWTTIPNKPPLTGLSHGAAGISLALFELYAVCGEVLFLNMGLEAVRFEQSWFSNTMLNWPDFRENIPANVNEYQYSVAWCNGAPGIHLARKRSALLTKRADLQEQASAALITTLNNVTTQLTNSAESINFSLCHGIAGNADILLDTGAPACSLIAKAVGDMGSRIVEQARLSWPSGISNRGKTPGLLMGTAGTGYFYLRLYKPEKFESILLPPASCGQKKLQIVDKDVMVVMNS